MAKTSRAEHVRKVKVSYCFSTRTQDLRNQRLSCSACMNKAFFSFGIGTNCNEKFCTKQAYRQAIHE